MTPDDSRAPAPTRCHDALDAMLRRTRVLLVKDDPGMAAAVRRGLQAAGIAVDHAPCGEDALWRAQAAEYAVIDLDLGLPGIRPSPARRGTAGSARSRRAVVTHW